MSLAALPPLLEDPTPFRRRRRRVDVLALVAAAGAAGMTWRDVAETMGTNHGAASGALSNLQDRGQLIRLRTRRGGCGVYVLPQYANPSDIAPRRSPASSRAAIEAAYQRGLTQGRDDGWNTGYDAAMTEVSAQAEHHRRAGADALRGQLLHVITVMGREVDPIGAASVHSNTCWRQHPACAVRAIRRAVENIDVTKKSQSGHR